MGGADHRTPLFRKVLCIRMKMSISPDTAFGAPWPRGEAFGRRALALRTRLGTARASTAPKFPVSYGPAPDGSVMAFKLDVKDGKPVLVAGWISRNMSYPEPVVIANGMVFALSSGENVKQVDSGGRLLTSKERLDTPVGNATLYVLDAETGKELFSSGSTMPGFSHFSAPTVSGGRVYVVTWDNIVYCYGLGQQ